MSVASSTLTHIPVVADPGFAIRKPEVARALYYQIEVGDTIPEEFFKIVAEILAVIYKNEKKNRL